MTATHENSPDAAKRPIRVMVVDDHDMFRRGVARLLRQEGMEVVGEASHAQAAIRLATELRPAVVLMDLSMRGLDGLQATRAIAESGCGANVVILTISDEREQAIEALLAGAAGFVGKDEPLEQLVAAITAAADGEVLIPSRVGNEVLRRLRTQMPAQAGVNDEVELSEREREVLRLIAEGKDNATIAAELVISPHTVKNHVASIFAKLGVSSRLQASVQALRRGLLS